MLKIENNLFNSILSIRYKSKSIAMRMCLCYLGWLLKKKKWNFKKKKEKNAGANL